MNFFGLCSDAFTKTIWIKEVIKIKNAHINIPKFVWKREDAYCCHKINIIAVTMENKESWMKKDLKEETFILFFENVFNEIIDGYKNRQ